MVKLESGGEQLPVIKKNFSANSFNLEKSSFLSKVGKTYIFTQIQWRNRPWGRVPPYILHRETFAELPGKRSKEERENGEEKK